jgi:ABC-type phosphate transport system auxiliary subunit
VIELKTKVHMMERLVDHAQKIKAKPDSLLCKELDKLRAVRDQVFQDLSDFVTERETHHKKELKRSKSVLKVKNGKTK